VQATAERAVAIFGPNRGIIITGDLKIPAAVLALLALAAGVVIFQFVRPIFEPQPQMIGGSVKIAVGGFDGVDARGQPVNTTRTDDLAQAVYTRLGEVANGPDKPSSVIWSVKETGQVDGARAQQRAAAINADVIVYGTLRVTEDATHLQPRFYVTATQLKDAQELAGDYALGDEIISLDDFARNGATFDDLRNRLVDRVVGLEEMLYGLAQYRRDDFGSAAASLKSAETNKNWTGTQGKEILYLFSGFTAGHLMAWPAATGYFDQGARLERTRARAELGKAEVLLEQSGVADACQGTSVDVDTLHRAAAAFAVALDDPSPPAGANIPAKAHYGLGQAEVCLSQAGREDRWDDAQQQFRAVIAEYDRGNNELKSLAADSHANLGLIAQPWSGEADPAARAAAYTLAADEYRQALTLSGEAHPSRRAFFAWSLGVAEEQLGVAGDDGEEVVEVVGHAPGEPAHRPHALDLPATRLARAERLPCLLDSSDAADDLLCLEPGGIRMINKKLKHSPIIVSLHFDQTH